MKTTTAKKTAKQTRASEPTATVKRKSADRGQGSFSSRLLKNPLQRQAPVGSVFDFRFVGTELGICTASEWL